MNIDIQRDRRLLQTLWQNRLFDCRSLTLADGTPIEIESSGIRSDSHILQPEFNFAVIKYPLQNMVMCGNIKIDTHSSHWRDQGTINMAQFSSVVLHVVFRRDMILTRADREIPTLVITLPPVIAMRYDELRHGMLCPSLLARMNPAHRHHLLTRLMSDRLKRKSDEIIEIYNSVGQDWHETAYIAFLRAFGFGGRKQAYESLARSLPYRFVRLHGDSLADVEALLLGCACFLNIQGEDEYTKQLMNRYVELRKQHALTPRYINWGGSAVRPGSSPVQFLVRIAAILEREQRFLERILKVESCAELRAIFNVPLGDYWKKHSAPSYKDTYGISDMTVQKCDLLIINFVIPLLRAYGSMTGDDELADKAVDMYEDTEREENRHTKHWQSGGYEIPNSFFSQALIQLSSEFCADGMCGDCPLGMTYLSRG